MNRRLVQAVLDFAGKPPIGMVGGLGDGELLRQFLATRDQGAFAEIVRRHGPMVWAVCRQLLANHADAEDAFQATFLAFVQSAKTIRNTGTLGAWLHGVAVRVATKLKRSAVRRRQREERVATPEATQSLPDSKWNELHAIIHDEVQRLPASMRTAFVLCELQGVQPAEAAKQLLCKPSTLAVRLSKARQRLLDRLAQRDIAPAVAVGLVAIGATNSAAVIPVRLLENLAKFPDAITSELPATLLELSQKVAPMTTGPTKLLLATLLVASGFGLSVGIASFPKVEAQIPDKKAPHATPAPKATPQAINPVMKESVVKGTVTMPDGSPAKGAIVWAAQRTHGPLVRKETTTDARGVYELTLPPGQWYFWARRETHGGEGRGPYQKREVNLTPAFDTLRIDMRLEDRGTFKGRVLESETGKPIVGAQLYLDTGLVLTTNKEGRFAVGGLRRMNHEYFVVAPGRVRGRVLFDTTASAETELEISIPTAAKIVGRVTDKAGKPIPGAWVGRYTSGHVFSLCALFTACNANGRFEYDGVTDGGPTQLTAGAPGYIENEKVQIMTTVGKPATADFVLTPEPAKGAKEVAPGLMNRRFVTGTILGPDGKPAEGVLVRWGNQPYIGAIDTKTGADGTYKLAVPDESNWLAILPNNFPPEFLKITDAGDQVQRTTLKKGHAVRGVVTDDDGKPIANVCVTPVIGSPGPIPVMGGNPHWVSESSAYTNADGKYELNGVPDQARFYFLKTGMSDLRDQALNLDGIDNTTTMSYGGAIKGRVLDRAGQPIKNFRVTVTPPKERVQGEQPDGYPLEYSGMGVRYTSADGSFVLTGLGAGGVYRIQAYADGHGEAVVDRVKTVPINKLAKAVATTIQAAAPSRLKLKLFTAKDGKPVPDARITLVDTPNSFELSFTWGYNDASWENMVRTRTDADGEAEFRSLSFSGATLLVQAPGFARKRIEWRDGSQEMKLDLKPESVLVGEVLLPDNDTGRTFYVTLKSDAGDQVSATVSPDDKGKFRINELPAGKWAVTLQGENAQQQMRRTTIELKEGETKLWKFEWK